MSEELNAECIRTHENHNVRIESCEKDITNLGESLRGEMEKLWNKLGKNNIVTVSTGFFQVAAIIIAIYLSK